MASRGATRQPAGGTARPAQRVDRHLRRHLPQGGQGGRLDLAPCDTATTNPHLAAAAADVAPGRHAALLLDQAGWHLSGKLLVPSNVTIVPLPAKCPELNAQENVWPFTRENWLSNRVFATEDDLVDHRCQAWNKLQAQPWRIMSLGLCDWAHGF
jgi:DDE superfamily endonuclease